MAMGVAEMATKMTFTFSDEVREALQRMAKEQRRSMTGVLEYLLLNPDEASNEQMQDAYEKGYEEAHEKGYDEAYEKGYEKGYEEGYEKGADRED